MLYFIVWVLSEQSKSSYMWNETGETEGLYLAEYINIQCS